MAYIDRNGEIQFQAIRFVDSKGIQQKFDTAKFNKCTNSNASGELCAHDHSIEDLIASAKQCAADQKASFATLS